MYQREAVGPPRRPVPKLSRISARRRARDRPLASASRSSGSDHPRGQLGRPRSAAPAVGRRQRGSRRLPAGQPDDVAHLEPQRGRPRPSSARSRARRSAAEQRQLRRPRPSSSSARPARPRVDPGRHGDAAATASPTASGQPLARRVEHRVGRRQRGGRSRIAADPLADRSRRRTSPAVDPQQRRRRRAQVGLVGRGHDRLVEAAPPPPAAAPRRSASSSLVTSSSSSSGCSPRSS